MKELYASVTADIIAHLERGVRPWSQAWKDQPMPYNALKGTFYKGINTVIFFATALKHGYPNNGWLGYNEALMLGAHVRKGESATRGIFVKFIERDDEKVTFARTFRVFNIAQLDNLPTRFNTPPRSDTDIDRLVKERGIDLRVGKPAYYPGPDFVTCPLRQDFASEDDYVSTLAHEAVHWTGAKTRLNREMKPYALEELTAELGSAFVTARLNHNYVSAQSPAYIDGWLKALKEDNRAIFRIAAASSKACDYLFG